jgi:hypothetical protein
MVIDEDAETFIERLGHNGSEIIFGHLAEPHCRRGHHIQEIIYWLFARGRTVTPIQMIPFIADPSGEMRPVPVRYQLADSDAEPTSDGDEVDLFEENHRRFGNMLNRHRGVIEGITPNGKRHAVAFDRGRIFDPDGKEYPFNAENCAANGFYPDIAWVVE